jgi:hypothetical protein
LDSDTFIPRKCFTPSDQGNFLHALRTKKNYFDNLRNEATPSKGGKQNYKLLKIYRIGPIIAKKVLMQMRRPKSWNSEIEFLIYSQQMSKGWIGD